MSIGSAFYRFIGILSVFLVIATLVMEGYILGIPNQLREYWRRKIWSNVAVVFCMALTTSGSNMKWFWSFINRVTLKTPAMKNCIVLLFALSILTACDKIDELTKFNMDYDAEVVINSTANISLPFDVFTPDMETNSESQFAVNDTRKDLIEDIRIKKLELSITAPSDLDFSFLESIEVFISADGLSEIRLAYITEVSETVGSSILLDLEDVDIQEYIKKDIFNLRLNTVTDEILTEDCYIDVASTFFVDAKILGI